jgi:hypothetical protein
MMTFSDDTAGGGGEAFQNAILVRMREAAQRTDSYGDAPYLNHEYGFLVGRWIDWPTLHRAQAEASRNHVATHEVLLAAGWISQADYALAVSRLLGLPCLPWDTSFEFAGPPSVCRDP